MIIAILLSLVSLSHAEEPDWTRDSKRHVVGGDIIHWGHGEHRKPEVALFIARHMAIKAILEECGGVASKEIVPRAQKFEAGPLSRAYAQVSIDIDACERARRLGSREPENKVIVEGQKLYDEYLHGRRDPVFEQKAVDLSGLEHRVGKLEEDVEDLKNREPSTTTVQIVHAVQPVTLPAIDSQKLICRRQLQSMANRLTMAAAEYDGNEADPELRDQYNAVMAQESLCESLR